ncbi:MAG: TerB family tellurite resistance protein [Nannocystaceae bacterium]|nr:TerB family tellurite resistance protein [bacterium]
MANDDALSSLAFLYLTFSHATDGALTMEEMRTLADKVKRWAPEADLKEIGSVIQGAVAEYKQVPAGQHLDAARQKAAALASIGDAAVRARIIADLESIASADGSVSEGERAFIDELGAQFGA